MLENHLAEHEHCKAGRATMGHIGYRYVVIIIMIWSRNLLIDNITSLLFWLVGIGGMPVCIWNTVE